MKRFISFIGATVAALSMLLPAAPVANAQPVVTWVRTYQQWGPEGCQWYVSQWSDGDYHLVPWICPPGVTPIREDRPVPAVRSYTEIGREGCVWNVALWADGIYTGAPLQCPYGVVPRKPGTLPPPPVYYYAPPAPPYYAPAPAPYYGPYRGY